MDHTPNHPPLDQPSRQLASDLVDTSAGDHAAAQGNEAVAEVVATVAEPAGDIASTKDVIGRSFGEISEMDLVDSICQMTSILNTMLTIATVLA